MTNKLSHLFVTPFLLTQNCAALALVNPLAGTDQGLATWFHAHLTPLFVTILRALCEPGSSEWVGVALFLGGLFFAWKRWWPSLATLIIAVPGGMLLNELVKLLIHRQRPFVDGPFVDWSGYSFASGHTIGATLLYGQILLFLIPVLKSRRWRSLAVFAAAALVVLVGFSRIALGAHYLTDVLAAMFFGSLWLAFCFFALKPLHGNASRRALTPDVVMAAADEVALVPVPVTETTEQALVASR
jgi:membrane-associated phospholipid phosphatase